MLPNLTLSKLRSFENQELAESMKNKSITTITEDTEVSRGLLWISYSQIFFQRCQLADANIAQHCA